MRILMISDHADPLAEIGSKEAGGQNIYVYNLAKYLSKCGFFVDVYTRYDRKNKKEIIKKNSHLRVIRVKAGPKEYIPRDSFLNVLDEFSDNILKRISREKLQYDIIHTNYWFSGLAGIRISRLLKIPMIHVYHSVGKIRYETFKRFRLNQVGDNNDFFKIRSAGEQLIASEAAGIVATSPIEKNLLKKTFKISGSKIKVIPIGVDLCSFKPIKLRKENLNKFSKGRDEKTIVYVGRIEWRKGIGTLLYALREVEKTYPKVKLYIIGGGKTAGAKQLEKDEINRQLKIIEELGLQHKVVYLGPRGQKELSQYYSMADLCVVPSYYEPFGIVPLESMACGTPVVASNTGGLKFTVKEGETGMLAKPKNYSDLAEKMLAVLDSGKSSFFEKCIQRVSNLFTWDFIVSKYTKYLEKMTRKETDENSNVGAIRRNSAAKKVWWNRTGSV